MTQQVFYRLANTDRVIGVNLDDGVDPIAWLDSRQLGHAYVLITQIQGERIAGQRMDAEAFSRPQDRIPGVAYDRSRNCAFVRCDRNLAESYRVELGDWFVFGLRSNGQSISVMHDAAFRKLAGLVA